MSNKSTEEMQDVDEVNGMGYPTCLIYIENPEPGVVNGIEIKKGDICLRQFAQEDFEVAVIARREPESEEEREKEKKAKEEWKNSEKEKEEAKRERERKEMEEWEKGAEERRKEEEEQAEERRRKAQEERRKKNEKRRKENEKRKKDSEKMRKGAEKRAIQHCKEKEKIFALSFSQRMDSLLVAVMTCNKV
uniref:Uncharacterized protein n=1 Tax=Paramoeba aestuarina TaxID=180227 RepID=A0A7S4JJH2_9EUKA|mmetsp:Transcript_10974/g.16584  ORF Transcript_10974/g.16584 Transcript_10974/m.16584 type:complete len:191 (+) Transcript_10974:87-659(+)